MRCPNCDYPRMKSWNELSGDERFIAERLPASAWFTLKERQKHLFCPRCRHEAADEKQSVC